MRKLKGYFTVEAALVLPLIFVLIQFIIYLLFFQYNRCLQELNTGVLTLRGTAMKAENNEERIIQLRKEAEELSCEKYIAWESEPVELKIEKGKIFIVQRGQLRFPFWKNLGSVQQRWSTVASCENYLISPTSFIRNCRKIKGG